jgi:hypothetical protein
MVKKHLKKCSTSSVIREMQIKTTLRFYLTPVIMVKIKNSGDNRCWKGYGVRERPFIVGGIASWYNHPVKVSIPIDKEKIYCKTKPNLNNSYPQVNLYLR